MFVALGSFSIVGIGMMAAILPLLYVERGAQMTFVLQSCLLLVSGVYYPVSVLPEWMQVLSKLSPATYVLDGVRAGLLDGVPVTGAVVRRRAADRHGHRAHPGRPLGVRPSGTVRQAHRQAEAGGLRWTNRWRPSISPTLQDLGWDPGWATAFLPFDAAGWRPARVVAAHRDAWVVATPAGDLDAVIAGRLRHEALGAADLPAVGDWVAVGHGGSAAIDAESDACTPSMQRTGPTVIQAVLPRRTAFGRSTADSGRRTGSRAADEQVLAANVDIALVVTSLDGDFNLRRLERYLAVAWTGGATPVIVLNKADVADDPAGLRVAAEAVAPGVEVRTISALTGDGVAALADDHLPPGRTAVVLGSSGVGKSTLVNALLGYQRLRTGAVREDDSRGRHTTTHRELVRLPAGALLIDTPGIRSLGVAGASDGLETAFADIADLADRLQVPGLPPRRRARLRRPGRARRRQPRSGAAREPSQARARGGPRRPRSPTRSPCAAERRRWKTIHASVAIQMRHKYGSDR